MDNKVESGLLRVVKYIPAKDGLLKQEEYTRKPDSIFLYFTVLTATLLSLSGGAAMTWSSPAIPKLKSQDTSVNPLSEPATVVEISMMVGLPYLTAIPGSLLAPLFCDFLGRKKSLYVVGLGMFLCDMVIAFGNSMIVIIAGRCVFLGLLLVEKCIMPVYITEVCESHNRAKFGCFMNLFTPLGSLYSYLIGPRFSYMHFSLLKGAPSFLFLLLFWFTKESPVYSLLRGNNEQCLNTLKSLRKYENEKELLEDFEEIRKTLNAKKNESNEKLSILAVSKSRVGRLGLLLSSVPVILQFVSGSSTIISYLGPMFSEAGTNLSGDTAAIVVGVVKCLSFLVAIFVVEKAGRRTLLLLSTLGCGIMLILVGCCFYLSDLNAPIMDYIRWLPLASMMLYFVLFAIGIGPLPPTLMGELFSPGMRSVSVSYIMSISSLMLFLFTSGFPFVAEYAGIHWCMWIFSLNCFLGAAFVYFLLPETGGKSILEIQEILKQYKFRLTGPL